MRSKCKTIDDKLLLKKMIGDIKELSSNEQLLEFGDKTKIPGLKDGLSSIMAESGSSLLALFGTKEKWKKQLERRWQINFVRVQLGCLNQ